MANLIYVTGNQLVSNNTSYQCAFGKAGFTENKTEGDNKTPIGVFALRECWYREDKLPRPNTGLDCRSISEQDGWCDAPEHSLYNQHIQHPFDASHETLWRADECYNLIIPLGYNDGPILPGKGSAIFMHVAKPGYEGTEGCIALAQPDLIALLAECGPDTVIDIKP